MSEKLTYKTSGLVKLPKTWAYRIIERSDGKICVEVYTPFLSLNEVKWFDSFLEADSYIWDKYKIDIIEGR